MERYKRIFEKECNCNVCSKKSLCESKNELKESVCTCESCDCEYDELETIEEECPGKPAGGGACANSDNSAKLKNVCQTGYMWDKTHEKCVPIPKK